MKKMMFAFVCSLGVGLAMMASPAQVCDDNTTADQTIDLVRHDASVRKLPTYVKHEWKMKKIDVSNIKVYKRGVVDKDPQPKTPKINATRYPVRPIYIIHDPYEFPPSAHDNGFFPPIVLMVKSFSRPHGVVRFFNSNDQQRLRSGHNSLCSPSYCVTKFGNGNGRYDTKTNGNGFSTIVHDPIIIDPAHQNMPDPIDPKLVDR